MMDNIFSLIVIEVWKILVMAGPYILFGFLAAGLIHAFISADQIASLLGKKSWKSVFTASIFGIPLPLCSCSVLPTAAAIRQKGASRGATTSFLISTPESGVDSIIMTYGLMDWTMALLRPLSAFITALVAGLSVNLWGDADGEEKPEPAVSSCCCSHNKPDVHHPVEPKVEHSESCHESTQQPKWKEILRYAFVDLSNDLAHWLALGLVLSAIISACIPETVFQGWAGQGITSLFLMLVISMPMYICASGSTPIAAVMIMKGLSPGAALVFLLAGPATNIGSVPLLLKMLGRRSTFLYLICIVLLTLLIGFSVNFLFATYHFTPHMAIEGSGSEGMGIIGIASALVLLVMLARGMWRRPVPNEWQKLGDQLASTVGIRVTWSRFFAVVVVLLLLSVAWSLF